MDINRLALEVQNRTPKPMDVKGKFAVMIPLINRNNRWEILYELRSNNIAQPGEVSFPGGKVEEGESFKQTAVRETMEELGIDRENINVIGELDFLVSYANFTIHCFLGIIMDIEFENIIPNPEEVAEIFTVPVNYFTENDPLVHDLSLRTENTETFPYHLIPNGRDYNFRVGKHRVLFYEYENHTIWGYTARMTKQLADIARNL